MAALTARRRVALPEVVRGWLPRDRFGWALVWPTALYLVTMLLMPVQAFWTPDAGAKFAQMLNLHWTGTGFDSAIAYPARDVDPQLRLLNLPFGYNSSPDGLFRTFYPMAFALVSRAGYALFGLRGLLLPPLIAGLVTALFAGLIVERWRPGRGWLAILLTAFATPVLFYSEIFWEHTLALAFALAGVWVLVGTEGEAFKVQSAKCKVHGPPHFAFFILHFALALGLVAVSCLFRLEMLLFEACCLGWCGYRLWELGRWGRIAIAGTAVAGAAVVAVVALTTGYAKTLGPGQRDVEQRTLAYLFDPAVRAQLPGDVWQRLFQVFYNVPDAGAVALRPMGYLTLGALALAIAALLLPRRRPLLLALSAAAVAAPAAVNIFYPGVVWSVHGLVLSCPLILAAIAYLRLQRPGRGLIAASLVVFALAELVFLNWGTAGGREWGARGVLVIYPLAVMVAAASWPERREFKIQNSKFKIARWMERGALGVMAVLSVGTQARGLVQLRSDLPVSASWEEALQALPPSIVATDIWWLTSTVTPVYYRHRFVLLPDGADQIADAQYLASQPLARSTPVVFATLCVEDCQLPPALIGAFEETSATEVRGLWLAQIRPRQAQASG